MVLVGLIKTILPKWAPPGPRLRHQRLMLTPEGMVATIFPKKRRFRHPPVGPRPTAQDAQVAVISVSRASILLAPIRHKLR
jgi:hypothetical protein